METIFYFVYCLNGGAPRYRHSTYQSALTEAQRLAERHGGEFVVLEAKAIVKPAPKTQTLVLFEPSACNDWTPPENWGRI